MKEVFVVGGIRTPFVRSFTSFSKLSTQELMEASLSALVKKFNLTGKHVDDVALGAVISSSTSNSLARECVLSAGLAPSTPAYNVQRACGTSLEGAYQLYAKIGVGAIDTAIAGGVDSNSAMQIEANEELRSMLIQLSRAETVVDRLKIFSQTKFQKIGLSRPDIVEKRTGLTMGEHCERMVKEWRITQEEQDILALQSHQRAHEAYQKGFYQSLLTQLTGVSKDSFVRGDTSLAKLKTLKPAFDKTHGTITAGNASPLSDGSSAVVLSSETGLKTLNLEASARIVDVQTSAVDYVGGEGLLMAPTIAVAKLLKRNNLKLQDFDFYEIHEAFAGQVLCTLKAWESEAFCREKLNSDKALGAIDRSLMNTVGGSLALGHPFAATGGRILASLSKLLKGTRKRGLISICTAGGMGIAMILEGA